MIVAGTRVRLVVGLLPVPSGLCNGASSRRARPRACHYPSPSLLPLPESVLSQCCPLSGTASVGAVALGMPWVPAALYHSCRSLHRSWLCCLSCISSVHPLKGVYRLPRVVGTGISHCLPPEVYHILLFRLSLFQERCWIPLRKLLSPFPHPWRKSSLLAYFPMGSPYLSALFQDTLSAERRKENLYQSISLPIDPVLWRASSCSLKKTDHSVICGEVPNRGPVIPVSIPYYVEDAAATLLFLATNP